MSNRAKPPLPAVGTTVYSIKDALTTGIRAVQVDAVVPHTERVRVSWAGVRSHWKTGELLRWGRDAFPTYEAARAAAKRLRAQKLRRLHKQMAALRRVTFPATPPE